MPTVSYNKVQQFVADLAKGVHNFTAGSTTLKVMLTTTAAASMSVRSNFAEIAASGGYTSGGNSASITASALVSTSIYQLKLADPAQWSASASTFPAFQYAVLYNDTATNDPVIGYWDYGSSVALGNGETFNVVFDPTNGVLQIS